ncbi:MAG: TolC family protein, partial [Candidatus Obscuribacterales bacterium]|nr:TolC family protein [Candidatus Obscuribacterales bacterium]
MATPIVFSSSSSSGRPGKFFCALFLLALLFFCRIKVCRAAILNEGGSQSAQIEYNEELRDDSASPALDLVDALNQSLMNNPRAAAIRSQFGIVQAGYAEATQTPNPFFFFDRGLVAEQVNRLGPILTVEAPWKLLFRLIIQKRLLEQSKFDLLARLWQLRAEVRSAYTELVLAQETLKTLSELYELSAKLEDAVRKRYMAGAVPELDVLKAGLLTTQSSVERIVGIQRLIKAKQHLNVILGKRLDSPL